MLCHYAECHYEESHILFIIMLSVVTLKVVMLSVVAPSAKCFFKLAMSNIFRSLPEWSIVQRSNQAQTLQLIFTESQ
jgi:hypothetical protein